jgi:hypothetical protein
MIQERYPELYDEIGWMNKAIQLHPEFITECHSKYIKAGVIKL